LWKRRGFAFAKATANGVSNPEVSGTAKHCTIQIAMKPERLGLREITAFAKATADREGISVVAKASSAEGFFAYFFVLQKSKRKRRFRIQRCC
jgi:hypothetical protein